MPLVKPGFRSRFLLSLAAALAASLAGCATQPPVRMITPLIFKDDRLDFVALVPPERRTTKVPVFYATTRTPVGAGERGFYGREPSTQGMQLGVAHVELGEPGSTYDELVASDLSDAAGELRTGRVESVELIGDVRAAEARTEAERQFIERIDRRLSELRNKAIVLYVHGYRVTFDDVAVLMGSLSANLGQGTTVAFQWPTGLHWWNYFTDCPTVEKYAPDVVRTIELLGHTQADYISLLAYSCGAPLLAAALEQLRGRYPDESREQLTKRFRIGSVVFAASDVDLKTFARNHVPAIMDLAQQTTIYMSRGDSALGVSTLIAGVSRIGRPEVEDLSVKEIQQLAQDPRLHGIDVTDVRGAHDLGGAAGHAYWYSNAWIATDVLVSLRWPLSPDQRCLVRDKEYTRIWLMPDDYPDCVAKGLLQVYPELRRAAQSK
jgi:esterase/lipase superfamily enzyme